MLGVFPCRHRNILCFVGIDVLLYTKPWSAGYNNQSELVYIIYRAPNSQKITGAADSSEWYWNTVVNRLFQVNYFNPLLYPVSVSVWPSPECGLLGTSIWGPHFENLSFVVYPITCSQTIENQHTISYYIKLIYYLLLYLLYFCRIYDILYISSFNIWIFWLVYPQLNFLHNCLILLTKNYI